MSFCFVRIETDDGIVGFGESCDSYGCTFAGVVSEVINQAYAPLLIGQEVRNVDTLADRMRLHTRRRLGDSWIAAHARSGIENALWDVAGRLAGRSVSDLIGRVHEDVEVYASAGFLEEGDLDHHVAVLRPVMERGVRRVKVRFGPDWERDLKLLAALQDEFQNCEWMVDGSETFTVATALRIAERLATLGVSWFEEPVPQHQRQALDELGHRSPVPIAYGEHLFGRDDALDTAVRRQVLVLQPDASTCGGITEARAMATIGASIGVRVVPHVCAGPLALAANLHFAATIPGIRLLEYPISLQPVWAAFAPTVDFGLDAIKDGCLAVPTSAGLGVDVDLDSMEEHPYELPGTRVAGTRDGLPDRFVGDR